MRMSLIDLLSGDWINKDFLLLIRNVRNLSETALEDNLLGCLSAELVSLEAEIDLSAGMDLSAEIDLPTGMGVLKEEANFFPVDLDERPAEGLGDTRGMDEASLVTT
uniref:Uncharacterized protein n=1 Tax=Tanacetum cinerariifolium TaxID=118510 RepID=A0A699R0F4_TANCI|nr:hypothetical protein [Tanacetum cinerariifolium]